MAEKDKNLFNSELSTIKFQRRKRIKNCV